MTKIMFPEVFGHAVFICISLVTPEVSPTILGRSRFLENTIPIKRKLIFSVKAVQNTHIQSDNQALHAIFIGNQIK